jgi:hypothetical protein
MASQKSLILQHLKEHGKITPITALNLCGCFRLSERIREIEKEGYSIFHDINIGKKKFSVYTLTS